MQDLIERQGMDEMKGTMSNDKLTIRISNTWGAIALWPLQYRYTLIMVLFTHPMPPASST